MGRRENTFRVDFSLLPKPPSYEEIHNFVGRKLGLTRENVLLLQPNKRLACVYVKVTELELAQKIVEEHDNIHEMMVEDQPFKVRIVLEDGAVDVRLFDLSETITNQRIAEFLESYGDVLSVRDVIWDTKFFLGGVPTGVRTARMIVAKNIPSSVVIDGQTTTLKYQGQRHTCIHCNEFVHTGIPCVQNKKLLVQKLSADMSYANVTKLTAKTNRPDKPPQQPQVHRQQLSKQQPPRQQQTVSKPTVLKPTMTNLNVLLQDVRKSSHTNMPPPAFPKDTESIRMFSDGNETDGSQSSAGTSRTRKPPMKKAKQIGDAPSDCEQRQ